jgi:hypothetical protein
VNSSISKRKELGEHKMEEEIKDELKEETESEEKKEESHKAKKDEEKPLDKMTVKELREIAVDIPGVTGVTAMKKEEVLAIIKEYRGIEDEEPVKKKKPKIHRPALSVKELKEKAANLKGERDSARKAKDREKVHVLRRRINRLKKQTRKAAKA